MGIIVKGSINVSASFIVRLDMTQGDFDSLSHVKQDEIIQEHIDFMETMRSADINDLDIDDVEDEE